MIALLQNEKIEIWYNETFEPSFGVKDNSRKWQGSFSLEDFLLPFSLARIHYIIERCLMQKDPENYVYHVAIQPCGRKLTLSFDVQIGGIEPLQFHLELQLVRDRIEILEEQLQLLNERVEKQQEIMENIYEIFTHEGFLTFLQTF